MRRTRGHERALAGLALGLLALIAELAGRSLTHRIDLGREVGRVSYASAGYYPVLLAAVKVGIALMLARIAWRFATARAAYRLAAALGGRPRRRAPRVRLELSPRLWFLTFLVTASIYLVQADAERLAGGRWPLLAPWLHSSALPVFAVLSVLVAVLFRAVERWLADYEELAAEALADAHRLTERALPVRRPSAVTRTPRSIFGLDFESRPPPATA
jgi:hypothetical protein